QMVLGGVVAGNLFWLDRRWAMVEQIFSGPFLRSEYLAGLVVTTLIFSLAGAGIMLLVASRSWGYRPSPWKAPWWCWPPSLWGASSSPAY
ncbi:ABC-type multidrug transport system, permease component, partial [mine drainage metagenome]